MELFVSTQNQLKTQVGYDSLGLVSLNFILAAPFPSVLSIILIPRSYSLKILGLLILLTSSNVFHFQELVAKALGVPLSRIVVRTKRVGEEDHNSTCAKGKTCF